MKRILHLTILSAILIMNMGCKKWLELEPKSEVSADVLLETPDGFSIALNGIYTSLSADTLYGYDLTHGILDVLGRCYDVKKSHYEKLKDYDYVSDGMNYHINIIWAFAYSTIANCNALLEEMNKKSPGFFKDYEQARLEGELLSIRALLHFDLLRLFAPAPVVQDAAAIPYYDALTNIPMPDKRTSEILQSIIADLTRSKQLQKDFDTSPEAKQNFQKYRFFFYNGFYGSGMRGYRMGYYSTTALLSCVALYAGNNQLAYANAMEVINDKTGNAGPTISFTPATIIDVGAYDRLLTDDLIFGLHQKGYEEAFNKVTNLTPNTPQIFGSDMNSDYRRKCYLTSDGKQLLKFDVEQKREGNPAITSTIPMFRLSEQYHIAAETLYDTDPDAALALLNTLRAKRGCTIPLPAIATKSAFLDAIVNDARREFPGEGKLFFLYKRLNRTILDETNGNQTLTDKFVLPVTER
jgi:hypothetical protein